MKYVGEACSFSSQSADVNETRVDAAKLQLTQRLGDQGVRLSRPTVTDWDCDSNDQELWDSSGIILAHSEVMEIGRNSDMAGRVRKM